MKTLKEHIVSKLAKCSDYWHDVDTYNDCGKIRHQIECRVEQVTDSNYLLVVSEALSLFNRANSPDSGIDCLLEVRGFTGAFRVVFTFWED